jgi:cephalosporin hydroxylase
MTKNQHSRLRRAWSLLKKAVVARLFHRLFYDAGHYNKATWYDTYWFGSRTFKSPLDMWVYQEILYEKRPDVVVETGTSHGGSALYMAHIMDQLGYGSVITIDIDAAETPSHPRITYVRGSSTDSAIVERIRAMTSGKQTMVVLDSDHSADHVLAELSAYADLVSVGQYLIVEDTNLNGHPVYENYGPGPWEALKLFKRSDRRFKADRTREKYLFTFNPGGFLLKARD